MFFIASLFKRSHPDDSFEWGKEAFWKGDYDLAIEYLNTAIEKSPNYHEIYKYRCMAYLEKGKYELAVVDANEMIHLQPSDYEGYSKKARALFEASRPAEARAVLKSVLESEQLEDNNKSYVFRWAGAWLRDKGDDEIVMEILTEALKERPNDYFICKYLYELHIQKGLPELALAEAEKA